MDPRFITTQVETIPIRKDSPPVTEGSPPPSPPPATAATPEASPSPTAMPSAAPDNISLEGAWATTDEQGDVFDLLLFAQGQAVTDWTKGALGPKGQHGKWSKQETGAMILYDNGSSDVIEKNDDGFRLKRLPAGAAATSATASPTVLKKIDEPMAKYVGVWKMNQEPDGSYLMIALQSNGRAMSTVNGGTKGKWEATPKGALCTWPDGWSDLIERHGNVWQRRSWVGTEANGDADTSEAERVGEGAAAGP